MCQFLLKLTCISQPQVFSCEVGKILKNIFLQNTYKHLLLYFCRAPSSKATSNEIAKSC